MAHAVPVLIRPQLQELSCSSPWLWLATGGRSSFDERPPQTTKLTTQTSGRMRSTTTTTTTTMFSIRTLSTVVALVVAIFAVAQYANGNPQSATPSVYEAPLLAADDPGRVQGNFFVILQENHFDDHIARIGTQRHVKFRLPQSLHDSYIAHRVDDGLLAAIRADPGVNLVECSFTRSYDEFRDIPIPNPT